MPMTKRIAKPLVVAYSTRKLRLDLREALRVEATLSGLTMEVALNAALEAGLKVMRATRQAADEPEGSE